MRHVWIFIAGLALTGCAAQIVPVPTATLAPTAVPVVDKLAGEPSIGPEDAPVVIQEWGDFTCPSCAIWEVRGVREAILAKYGDKVRFVWHDYAVLSPESLPSAEAARCAHEQGKFWEYHHLLYENYPDLTKADFKRYAAEIDLDMGQFDECVENREYFDAVSNGLRSGMDTGFFSTPSFLVNDQKVLGGQPIEVFEKAIDAAMGQKE